MLASRDNIKTAARFLPYRSKRDAYYTLAATFLERCGPWVPAPLSFWIAELTPILIVPSLDIFSSVRHHRSHRRQCDDRFIRHW